MSLRPVPTRRPAPLAHGITLTRTALLRLVVLTGTVGGLLAACGSSAVAQPTTSPTATSTATAGGTHTLDVRLSEWKVEMPTTLPAGHYVLHIVNVGAVEHELIVLRDDDLAPSQYPQNADGLVEDAPGVVTVSDGDNVPPGGSQERTIDLTEPGKYLFVCNLPGHFRQGMYTVVEVTQGQAS